MLFEFLQIGILKKNMELIRRYVIVMIIQMLYFLFNMMIKIS